MKKIIMVLGFVLAALGPPAIAQEMSFDDIFGKPPCTLVYCTEGVECPCVPVGPDDLCKDFPWLCERYENPFCKYFPEECEDDKPTAPWLINRPVEPPEALDNTILKYLQRINTLLCALDEEIYANKAALVLNCPPVAEIGPWRGFSLD